MKTAVIRKQRTTLRMADVRIKETERVDDLERNGLKLIQDTRKFCFGMDAVLLSGFARVRKGEKAMDLGTGTGIIPILLSAKTEGAHFTGLEIQEEMAEMAGRSVLLNDLGERVSILCGDIREAGKDGILYDVVTANPPYVKVGNGEKSPEDAKALSRHEVACTLSDVCAAAGRLLKTGGRFYMVHRPLRLSEIMSELTGNHLEPKRMKFVHPFLDKEANMVLIEAVKGAGCECRIEKPVIVYKNPGEYTEEIYSIYGY